MTNKHISYVEFDCTREWAKQNMIGFETLVDDPRCSECGHLRCSQLPLSQRSPGKPCGRSGCCEEGR